MGYGHLGGGLRAIGGAHPLVFQVRALALLISFALGTAFWAIVFRVMIPQWLVGVSGWHWQQWVMTWLLFSGPSLVFGLFTKPETYVLTRWNKLGILVLVALVAALECFVLYTAGFWSP
jgi:hypothetical protein